MLLALEPQAPSAAALPLGGRVLEAWWAEPGPELPRRAVALSERLGIPFSCFDLDWLTQATLEAGDARRAGRGRAAAGRSAAAEPPGRSSASRSDARGAGSRRGLDGGARSPAAAAEAAARVRAEAVVLGCDLEVRERLRFMVWMRRVQAERRAAALETGAGR